MNNQIDDKTGRIYWYLTVIRLDTESERCGSAALWLCQCQCGNIVSVASNHLATGAVKSCGCLRSEIVSKERFLDLDGEKFGRLTVQNDFSRHYKSGKTIIKWRCICDCGKESTVSTSELRSGGTKSCGCLQRERTSAAKKTHGLGHSPEYAIWRAMNARAPVCDRWKKFETFFADVGPRPMKGLSMCRQDLSKPYQPGNGAWVVPNRRKKNGTA